MGAFSLLVAIAFPMADVRITFLWFFERALLAPESYILFHAAVKTKRCQHPAPTHRKHPLLHLLIPIAQGSLKSMLLCLSGQNEGTISVAEGEMLYVIEEDKGDGWTRIRRNEDEEGYVPTSYVEVYLDKNAKGAMTYI